MIGAIGRCGRPPRPPLRLVYLITGFLTFAGSALAADEKPATPPPAPIKIVSISSAKLSIGRRVDVELEKGGVARLKADGSKPLVVVFDGRTMAGINCFDSAEENKLTVDLSRTSDNQSAWAPLLGLGKPRDVKLQLEGPRERTQPKSVVFDFYARPAAIWGAIIFALLVAVALVVGGMWTTMLRDAGAAQPENARTNWRAFGTFSLGRVQMAFWFVLVIGGYLLIWGVTGDTPPMTTSVLALIGIGSGTALGAALIDDSKRVTSAALEAQRGQLVAAAAAEGDANKKKKLEDDAAALQAKIDHPTGAQPSANFLTDLLTDVNGWSFHRLQLVVWTLIIGAMFCASVWHHLVMPDFDTTLLALIGISSGTYIGFKIPEKQG